MNTQSKKFLIRFLLFCIVLVIIDNAIGLALKKLYDNQQGGHFYRANQVVRYTTADLLILGSSRANHNYVTTLFEKTIHRSAYNGGHDGVNLIYYMAMLSAALERYTPQIVIIDITPNDLSVSEEGKLAALLPYHNNPAINKYIEYDGRFEKYKLLSKMYPYNSILNTMIFNQIQAKKHFVFDYKGYTPFYDTMAYHPRKVYSYGPIKHYRTAILEDMLKHLVERNVDAVLVISPSYKIFKKPDVTVAALQGLANKYKSKVHFMNFEDDPEFSDHKLFRDEDHLNDGGAKKLSTIIANKIAALYSDRLAAKKHQSQQ